MFAEEINDKQDYNNNNETINIFINILNEVFPESNKFFTESNSINIPEIINSNLFDEIQINEKFKKVIKTTVNYTYLQEDNDNEDNINILQAIKNDITILIPEIKKYSKKHNKNKTINKVVDILDRDNELTRTKNLNTLFSDYNTTEKTLEELLIDLIKQNTTKSNNKNLNL